MRKNYRIGKMHVGDLINLLEKYGIKGGIVFFTCITLFIIYKTGMIGRFFTFISEKYIEYSIKKKGKFVVSDVNVSDVLNHDIFNYIDFWRYSRVPTFHFSTEYRTIVFRKYLMIYLKAHKEVLLEYVNSKTYMEMDDSQLWKSFLTLINDIVYTYEKEMLEAGIPNIIIEKMKTKNNDVISLTIDLIEGICTSQFYKSENNLLKIYSILNIMLSILENTIHGSEGVCNSINGQLKGLTFQEGGKIYKEP